MKKLFALLLTFLVLPAFFIFSYAQKKTMTWTTKSANALKLAEKGANHMMNIEFAQAYEEFREALELDKNFTIPLVFMANLTVGDVRKAYAERAVKSAVGKTEGEKLFASTVAPGNTQDGNRATWEKLYKMFPDGSMVGTYYVFSRATREETFSAAQDYIKKFPDKPWMYNSIAYYYMQDKNDYAMAKENFMKYIQLYPEGCNPYDSMGEYYFNAGDLENSEKYYNMALEKYPFNSSSIDKLKEIKEAQKKKAAGN